MKKIKSIITGILSGAVFFIAVQVGVAQEKKIADKVEMKEAVAAMVLVETVQKLNAEFAIRKPDAVVKSVMEEPIASRPAADIDKSVVNLHWYRKIGTDNYIYDGWGPSPETADCPQGGAELCAAGFDTQHDQEEVTDDMAESTPHQLRYDNL